VRFDNLIFETRRLLLLVPLVAFFAHWIVDMHFNKHAKGVVAWAGTLGNAVRSPLSAEERISHYI